MLNELQPSPHSPERVAEERLRQVTATARCILWQATVEEKDGKLGWQFSVLDEAGAQKLLPLDLRPGESYTEAIFRSIMPEDVERLRLARDHAIRTGQTEYSREFRVRMADGSVRWLASDVRLAPEGPGRWQAVGVCVDITERHELDARLRQALEEAERASRAKSAFLATMSHELLTPLNQVLGYADLLLEAGECSDPEERAHAARCIREAGARLQHLVHDVLSLASLEAGEERLEPGPVDVAGVVDTVTARHGRLAERRGNTLAVSVPEGLEPVVTDGEKLRRVLDHLLENALKFTRGGEVTLTLRIEDGCLRGCLEDTGIGMSPDQVARLFEGFWQADTSATRTTGGSGVGLALTRHFLRLMGGEIHVESERARGTRVSFWIPVSRLGTPPSGEESLGDP